MGLILFARARGALRLFQDILEGNPFAIIIGIAAVVITLGVCWLAVVFMKRKGQRFADAIGGCEYLFSPDGLFGRRIFVISGEADGVPFTVTAKKIRKGDYRTYVEIQKPRNVTWEDIVSGLGKSKVIISGTMDIKETADTVTLEYFGVGGDGAGLRTFLADVATGIKARAGAV